MRSDQQHAQRGDQIGRRRHIAAAMIEAESADWRRRRSGRQKRRRLIRKIEIECRFGDGNELRPVEHGPAGTIGREFRLTGTLHQPLRTAARHRAGNGRRSFSGHASRSVTTKTTDAARVTGDCAVPLTKELVLPVGADAAHPGDASQDRHRNHGPQQGERESGFANAHGVKPSSAEQSGWSKRSTAARTDQSGFESSKIKIRMSKESQTGLLSCNACAGNAPFAGCEASIRLHVSLFLWDAATC